MLCFTHLPTDLSLGERLSYLTAPEQENSRWRIQTLGGHEPSPESQSQMRERDFGAGSGQKAVSRVATGKAPFTEGGVLQYRHRWGRPWWALSLREPLDGGRWRVHEPLLRGRAP